MAVVWLFDCLFGLDVRLLGGVLDAKGVASKIGIKCFSRFLLVARGRKPLKPHFHGPIRW